MEAFKSHRIYSNFFAYIFSQWRILKEQLLYEDQYIFDIERDNHIENGKNLLT